MIIIKQFAIILFCVGIWIHVPAQNSLTPDQGELIEGSSSLVAKSRKKDKDKDRIVPVPDKETPVSGSIIGEYPQPYKDLHFSFLSTIQPLPSYISIDGEYKIDCTYVQNFNYFEIWETNKLNPYGFNGEDFNDTISVKLKGIANINDWVSPLDKSIITSDFGLRRAAWHYGTDFRVNVGTPVYVVSDGVIRVMGYQKRGFGRYIIVRHTNGLETVYAHLSKSLVVLGQEVKTGDIIGKAGNSGRSTAPHLHFEIRYSGNAINPNEVYDFSENKLISSELTLNSQTFAYLKEANQIRYHVVRSGNTLSGISYRYGVSMSKICSLNGISRNSILHIGQRIRIN